MAKLGPSLWDDPNYVLGSIIPRALGFDLGSPALPFKNLYVENAIPISDNLHLTGTLEVDGISTLGVTSVGSTLDVVGAVTLDSTFDVAGLATFAGNLNVLGSIVLSNNLTVNGETTFTAAVKLSTAAIVMEAGVADPNALAGTFTANEGTEVVISTTAASTGMTVQFGLSIIGGIPAGMPFISSITPGVSFGVKTFTGDTSVYNWNIIVNSLV